jgi:hypothetical protein
MVSMLALTMAFAAVGCGGGQKTEETSTSTETPPMETTTPSDTAMPDTMGGGMDTTMHH